MAKRDPIAIARKQAEKALVFNMHNALSGVDAISPIEQIFIWQLVADCAWLDIDLTARLYYRDAWGPGPFSDGMGDPVVFVSEARRHLTVGHEVHVGKYRCDFLLEMQDSCESPELKYLAIECDGHDYHERTKEQASHDKARDRFFLEQGLDVMRFTGSELHRNARACTDQVIEFLCPQSDDLVMARSEAASVGTE